MDLLQFVRGCTFDDFLLTPQLGVVPSRDPALIDLTTAFSEHVMLKHPLVSMLADTSGCFSITCSEKAVVKSIRAGSRLGTTPSCGVSKKSSNVQPRTNWSRSIGVS